MARPRCDTDSLSICFFPRHTYAHRAFKLRYAWLDYHARASLNHDVQAQQAISTFHCYNPVNLQRERAGYNLTDYAFVGITEEMERSVCLLAYYVRGMLPKQCRCGKHDVAAKKRLRRSSLSSSNGRAQALDLASAAGGGDTGGDNGGVGRARRDYQAVHETHGVGKHKGSSEVERRLILSLVQEDILLYQTAKRRFEQSLEEVEAVTQTKVCHQ